MNTTTKLYLKAKKIISGGTQLLSKRPEMFAPGVRLPCYSRPKGCAGSNKTHWRPTWETTTLSTGIYCEFFKNDLLGFNGDKDKSMPMLDRAHDKVMKLTAEKSVALSDKLTGQIQRFFRDEYCV